MENNTNDENNNKERYTDSGGTGVLSAIIFMIVTMVAMYFLAKFMGN